MTTGSMRNMAAALNDQDKRLIAEWVGGRKLDTDLVGAAGKMPNACASHPPVRESNLPAWNGWGVDYRNSRFQPGAAAGLSPGQVSRLQLKWAFGFPGATALYSQTVYDGRLYVTSNAGYVYSLDAETGCLHWGFRAQSAVRSGLTIGRLSRTDPRLAIFFGDIHGTAYALSASTGEEIWKTLTDPHPLARITGTPVLFEGRLYVPVASLEEPESGQADYACCTFRGYMSALDSATGRQIWKTYTIPEVPKVVGKNSRGKEMLEPSGAGIWATPTHRRQATRALRHDRQCLPGHTKDSQRGDGDEHRHGQSAVVDAGAPVRHLAQRVCAEHSRRSVAPARWRRRTWRPRRGACHSLSAGKLSRCLGPDWDFAAPAALATTTDGRDILIAPQKQGLVWAINPGQRPGALEAGCGARNRGRARRDAFRRRGGQREGVLRSDQQRTSRARSEDRRGGLVRAAGSAQGRENQRGVVGAVTLIPGVLLSGARDGMIRATSSRTGQLLWEFDSAKEFTTVNGVPARGGSAASGGPVVANGMVFIGSGYPGFQGGQPGNVLLAFAPAVRLDVHADELKRRSEPMR